LREEFYHNSFIFIDLKSSTLQQTTKKPSKFAWFFILIPFF